MLTCTCICNYALYLPDAHAVGDSIDIHCLHGRRERGGMFSSGVVLREKRSHRHTAKPASKDRQAAYSSEAWHMEGRGSGCKQAMENYFE